MSSGCTWLCDVCGKPVTDNDMVGYYEDSNRVYVKGSLGFWHNTHACSREKSGVYPLDNHIRDFKDMIPQEIHVWLHDGVDPKEVGIMVLRCLVPGYDLVYRNYREARSIGIIEPNMPAPGLWPHEIDEMLRWLKDERRI